MISREELLNIAILAKLKIKEDDVEKLLEEMEKILDFADDINSVKLDENISFDNINGLVNVFRQDEVRDSLPQEAIVKNSKTNEDGFFILSNSENL